jgi:hypothetical protein
LAFCGRLFCEVLLLFGLCTRLAGCLVFGVLVSPWFSFPVGVFFAAFFRWLGVVPCCQFSLVLELQFLVWRVFVWSKGSCAKVFLAVLVPGCCFGGV